MLRRAYSIFFWICFLAVCLVMFLGAFVLWVVVGPFDPVRRVQHLYSAFWCQLFFYLNPGWHQSFEHRNRLPWHGAAILVSNHESLGDILVLFGLYRPFKWVSKSVVFKVPLIGWNMSMCRYVPLVRGNRESVLRMMSVCREWLDRGVPVMMFPEGTRSRDGEVQPFKDGAFQLAMETGHPVIPIALTGTAHTLPKNGFLLRYRNHCRIYVLKPVDPADFGSVAELRDHVRELIIAQRARMQARHRPPKETAPEALRT